MNKTTLVIVMVFVVIVAGYFLFQRDGYREPQETGTEPQVDVRGPAQQSVKEVSMNSGNFFFTPKSLTLSKNQPVKITFQNTGSHTFTSDELGINVPLLGGSPTVEFTPTQAGTLEYYCSVPGHRELGMLGSLKVE